MVLPRHHRQYPTFGSGENFVGGPGDDFARAFGHPQGGGIGVAGMGPLPCEPGARRGPAIRGRARGAPSPFPSAPHAAPRSRPSPAPLRARVAPRESRRAPGDPPPEHPVALRVAKPRRDARRAQNGTATPPRSPRAAKRAWAAGTDMRRTRIPRFGAWYRRVPGNSLF